MHQEIIIAQPERSYVRTPLARWSHIYEEYSKELIKWANVDPDRYPNVVELFAGDGPLAHILINFGWPPENITCVDRVIPQNPFTTEVKWNYWDLRRLAWQIQQNRTIPDEISRYANTFDIVTILNAPCLTQNLVTLARFFQNHHGVIISEELELRLLSHKTSGKTD